VTRTTWAPRATTPVLHHRLSNWKRASMAAALGYHAADPERGARLCFHVQPDSYDTATLIGVLTHLHGFYTGERVVLVWDGLGAHRSHAMRDWVAAQTDWLTVERLPAYAPELNPVEGLWANLKAVELANFAGDRLVEVVDTAERGIRRVCAQREMAWSFLAHAGLVLDHNTQPNFRKPQ
jgi:transposase